MRSTADDAPLEHLWPNGPAEVELPPGEVHLWAVALAQPPDFLARCEALLSADERERAARFRAGDLRHHYIAGRGILRLLLGRYLCADPASVPLVYQPHGKPELALGNECGLEFNLSHSAGLALYAFALRGAVGVDVEAARPMPNAADLLERFFSPDEVAQWRRAAAERQPLVFFQGWTRKEAWLKAVGSGLSFPLDEFCVTMDGPARVLSIRGDAAEAARWRLESSQPCRGYIAAVAWKGEAATVRQWRFEE